MNKKLQYITALLIAILTTGCASYKAHTLSPLSPYSANYSEQKNGIVVSSKAFTVRDCKKYLDRDVIAKGYQPIHITIENETNRYLQFSKNNISLPAADPSYVADLVHTSTVGRSTAYGVGALFFWPLAIPAIVDGVKSSNANEQLDNDFVSKATGDQSIAPFSRVNGLIFVPVESFQEFFTITVVDKETREEIIFKMNVHR